MTGSASVVVALSVALMIFAGPVYDYSKRTAEDLLAPDRYVTAVIGDHE
jgi:formate hydrogenlyase subunit 3/multisubunit Na+/H+ antiporter MnhD subunit